MANDMGAPRFGDGRYYDELSIIVQLVPSIGAPPSDVLGLELHGAVVDASAAGDLLEASVSVDGWVPHELDYREHRHSWGAAGAGAQILLLVSEGVIGNAAYQALKAALQRVGEEAHKRNTRPLQANELTAAEATARSQWLVEQRHAIPAQELTVVGITETFAPKAFEVRLEKDGIYFDVTVQESDGLVAFSRITVSR